MEVQCFELKTEADSNDSTLCSDDDKPSTGIKYLLLKALTTQTSNNPNRTQTQNFGFFPISRCSLANSCPVPIDKIFVVLQKMSNLIYFPKTVCTMLKCVFLYSLHSTSSGDNLKCNCVVVYNK